MVRAEMPALARDLMLVQVMARSALIIDAEVLLDAVCVQRLRAGQRPVRELV